MLKTESDKVLKAHILEVERELDDLQHDACWLIQHGYETEGFDAVKNKLDAINQKRRELLASMPCNNYTEDPAICDDVGEPKGQCTCGWGEEDHRS